MMMVYRVFCFIGENRIPQLIVWARKTVNKPDKHEMNNMPETIGLTESAVDVDSTRLLAFRLGAGILPSQKARFIWVRLRLLELRMHLLELRMILNQCRIRFLKCGYSIV